MMTLNYELTPKSTGKIQQEVLIEPITLDEKKAFKKIFNRSFPLFQRLFFSWTPNVLVAKHEGKLVGGIVLKIYPLTNGKKGGCITWIFTEPTARGLGVGQHLVEAALDFFTEQECEEVVACVEGYNTSSSKLFSSQGFSILSPGNQLSRYGIRLLPTWFHIFHLVDIGHFVWGKPKATHSDCSILQWWGSWLINILIALFIIGRGGNLATIHFIAVPILYLLILGARYLAMKWVASILDVDIRFRAWETGFLVSIFIALFIGGLFPIPGGVYPLSDQWSYRKLIPKLGPLCLAGVIPTFLIASTAWFLMNYISIPVNMQVWVEIAFFISINLSLFDIVFIFFPFKSFNGRKIYDWQPFIWLILTLAVLLMMFF